MASLLPNTTTYAALVASDSDFRAVVWNKIITQNYKYRSKWRHFSGPDGSGMPITKKSDLDAGMAQDVVFTGVSPILGQGKLGENLLREATVAINENSFRVRVDLLRQGVSYSQLINWLRKDFNPEQKAVEMLADWSVRKYDDDIQIKLREYARLTAPGNNLLRVNNRATEAALLSTDYTTPSYIEFSKARLMGLGATPLATDVVESGAICPQFLYYGADAFMRPLRSNATYLGTLQYGDVRGKDNALFSGKYQMWDNNIIYPAETGTTDGDGRQGSPLLPLAFLGTAINDTSTVIMTGGGTTNPAGTGDYFAYFPGFSWYIVDGETLPTDSATYYAMIYNISGVDIGKYEIVSYVASGIPATGKQVTIIRGSQTDGAGNQRAVAANRWVGNHPSGSVIIPCTSQGVPIGWALHMGADALRYATGMVENQRITQEDDFGLDQGIGVATIRGMAPFTDRRLIATNYVLIQGAVLHPFVSPVAFTG